MSFHRSTFNIERSNQLPARHQGRLFFQKSSKLLGLIELRLLLLSLPVIANFDSQLVRQILDEIAGSQAHQFFLIAIKWALLAALPGLFAGILAIVAFRKIGWYRSGWRFERWIRWPLWISSVVGCAGLLGTAGFFVGVIRGSEYVFQHSQLATKVFPEVGGALADGVAAAQFYLAGTNAAARSGTNLSARIAAFRDGIWEVNAPELLQQLDTLQSGAVSKLVHEVEQQIVTSSPRFQSGLPKKLLHHSLQIIGTVLVQRKINSEVKRSNLDDFYHALHDRLISEARRRGNPDTISHQEISTFLEKEVVVPSAMKPIRLFAGGQAKVFIFLAVLSLVVPAALFRITCGRVKATKSQAEA